MPSHGQRTSSLLSSTTVYRASLAMEFVPKAKVIFMPKAGEKNYTATKSFRPTRLTSFPFKFLKRIVDRYLLEGTLHINPFHKNNHKAG